MNSQWNAYAAILSTLSSVGGWMVVFELMCLPPIALAQSPKAPSATSIVATVDESGWLVQSDCLVFAIDAIEIPSRDAGMLEEVRVSQGTEVSQGESIGKLDTRAADLEWQLAKLHAQIASQEANDDSDVLLANSIVEEAKIILENFQSLRQRNSATETELRQKQIAVTQAEVKLTHAKQAAEQKRLRARMAQASILAAEEKLQRLQLVAPFEGTITEVFKKEGEWVQPGQAVMKLTRLNELRVDFFILRDAIDPATLVGKSVQVYAKSSDGSRTEFAGTVTSFDPEVTSQGIVRVHTTIQNLRHGRSWKLLPGMTVTLRTLPSSARTDQADTLRKNQTGIR